MSIQSLPWSVVKPPIVRPTPRPSLALTALKARDQLRWREEEFRRSNRMRALNGVLVVVGVIAIGTPLLWGVLWYLHAVHDLEHYREMPGRLWLLIDGVLLLCTVPLALLTRRKRRSDMVREFLQSGSRGCGSEPLLGFTLALVCAGLFYGEFLIIDSLVTTFLRIRLRDVDRTRAASILAALFVDPRGLDPRTLLRHGEQIENLRFTLAYLMEYEWIDLAAEGDYVNLLSPAKRALRHCPDASFM
jgi:hypothetical protein